MLGVGAILWGCQGGGHLSCQLDLVLDGAVLAACTEALLRLEAQQLTGLQATASTPSSKHSGRHHEQMWIS